MVYPRITRVKVIPRLSPGYQILKVMDNACSAYVLQCTVLVQSSHRQTDSQMRRLRYSTDAPHYSEGSTTGGTHFFKEIRVFVRILILTS